MRYETEDPAATSTLADASAFACLPFASDLKDDSVYGPIGDDTCGVFSAPARRAPQAYGCLQDHALRTRRRAASRAGRVATADDLAALLEKVACDDVVMRHSLDFALPPGRRPRAALVGPRAGHGATSTKFTTRPCAQAQDTRRQPCASMDCASGAACRVQYRCQILRARSAGKGRSALL